MTSWLVGTIGVVVFVSSEEGTPRLWHRAMMMLITTTNITRTPSSPPTTPPTMGATVKDMKEIIISPEEPDFGGDKNKITFRY